MLQFYNNTIKNFFTWKSILNFAKTNEYVLLYYNHPCFLILMFLIQEQFLISHKLTLAILSQILDDPASTLSHFLDAANLCYSSPPSSSLPLSPLLQLILPYGEHSRRQFEKLNLNNETIASLWAFYKLGELKDVAFLTNPELYVHQSITN